jgi:hypothetical protein
VPQGAETVPLGYGQKHFHICPDMKSTIGHFIGTTAPLCLVAKMITNFSGNSENILQILHYYGGSLYERVEVRRQYTLIGKKSG